MKYCGSSRRWLPKHSVKSRLCIDLLHSRAALGLDREMRDTYTARATHWRCNIHGEIVEVDTVQTVSEVVIRRAGPSS